MGKNNAPRTHKNLDADNLVIHEQVSLAQQMVVEAYLDNLNGSKTYTCEEVESLMKKIIRDN